MNKRLLAKNLIAVLTLATLAATAAVAEPSGTRALRRSDVVFMYDNPERYDDYGCTVLGWAGRADAEHIRRAHEKGVRLFATSVGFRTEFRGMIDFSDDFLEAACRTFAGEPFVVPWLWDHEHKGQPAWHFCTNSPLYRDFLYSRLESRMAAGPDGLHIDDYTGTSGMVTWQAACFCRHCTAGFREYLKKSLPAERLAELGIEDPGRFDYRQYLLDRGVKPDEYNKRRASLPLADEFLDFQVKAAHRFVAEYRRRAEELRGQGITLSVNSCPGRPISLVIAPQLSYFCCEVWHDAAKRRVPSHPIYVYKLADGLGRPVASTASGHDWAYVAEHKLTGLVRTWSALSYVYGHNFMAPHRQWCYTQQKGTHWANFPTQQTAGPYRFVRRCARLLDGYEAVAPVAVVYDNAARRRGKANIEPIVAALAERNLPFTVVVAGDDWLEYRLSAEQLAPFRAVVAPKDLAMDAGQRAAIDRVAADGRLVTWPDDDRLGELVPPPIVLGEGSGQLAVVPRAIPGDAAAPVAVHLLNLRYDGERDAMLPRSDLSVALRRDLFSGRQLTRATLHAPGKEPSPLSITSDGDLLRITVPELGLWAIVELAGN